MPNKRIVEQVDDFHNLIELTEPENRSQSEQKNTKFIQRCRLCDDCDVIIVWMCYVLIYWALLHSNVRKKRDNPHTFSNRTQHINRVNTVSSHQRAKHQRINISTHHPTHPVSTPQHIDYQQIGANDWNDRSFWGESTSAWFRRFRQSLGCCYDGYGACPSFSELFFQTRAQNWLKSLPERRSFLCRNLTSFAFFWITNSSRSCSLKP